MGVSGRNLGDWGGRHLHMDCREQSLGGSKMTECPVLRHVIPTAAAALPGLHQEAQRDMEQESREDGWVWGSPAPV